MKVKQKEFAVNPVYLDKFFPSQKRYAVLMGGAGSGKSVATAQKILLRLKTEPGHRFLVLRKVGADIRESVYRLFNDLIDQYELHGEFTVLKSEFRIIHKSGNEIIFMGLDNQERLKSITGITGVWAEECTELDEMDLAQLDLRLRGKTTNYKQIILTFNPVREDHWLKERFFDNEDPDTFTLVTTFNDNMFIDEEYKRILTEKYKTNTNLYRVYVLGEWGLISTGDAFYKNFSPAVHVKELRYDPALPLGMAWDFNTQPYCACLLFQIKKEQFFPDSFEVIDEITLKSPKNTISDTCNEFKKRYSPVAGLNIYGDASGMNNDTKHEKGFNCFSVIEKELAEFKPVLRVPTKNPPVMMRGLFINNILGNPKHIIISIDKKCKNLINDLAYLKEDSDGTKSKTMTKDKETGASYQKYGHCSDAMDYGLCYVFDSKFEDYQRGDAPARPLFGPTIRTEGY